MSENTAHSVVVGYDSSEISQRAVAWASVAADLLDRPLQVISARESEGAPERSGEAVASVREQYPDVEVSGTDPVGSAAGVMVRAGENAHILVMGSRGRGRIASTLLGTVSLTTAQHASCPVVIVHGEDHPDGPPRRIVVGADGSASSTAALDFALSLVADGGEIRLLLAWSVLPVGSTAPIPTVAEAMLEQTLAGRSKDGITITAEARPGAPRDVLKAASEDCDLLVIGRRGQEGFRGLKLGSTAHHALLNAQGPVAVVTGPNAMA